MADEIKLEMPPELVDASNPPTTDDEDVQLTDDQLDALEQEIKQERQFGERPGLAGTLGAARGLSFGISDQVLTKLKITDPETLRQLKERNKAASITGEVAGIAGPAVFSGGTSVLARGAQISGKGLAGAAAAGKVTEKMTAKALEKIISDTGNKKLAREIIKKTIPKTAGSAVEGSFFGAGQLISEDALGEAELNAENLMTHAGVGAAFGGAVGSVFGPMEALKPVVSKGIKGAKQRVQKFVDPKDAALDLTGASPSVKTKLKKNNPQLVNDLPEYFVEQGKLGKLTNTENLKNNVEKSRNASGKEIGNILEEMERIGTTEPGILPSARSVYQRIVNTLDDKFINRLKDTPGFKSKVKRVQALRDDFAKLADNDKPLKVSQLQKLRKEMDELAGLEKELGKRTLGEQGAFEARKILREEIDRVAERADAINVNNKFGDLFKRLKEANKNYSIGSEILPFLTKKVDKEKLYSLTDLVAGGVSGSLGLEAVIGVVGVKKFLESDLRRRLTILASMEKQNRKITSKINTTVGNFFKGVRGLAVPVSTKILLESGFGQKIEPGKKPKKAANKQEAFKNITDNIARIKSDPQFFVDQMTANSARINHAAPNAASFIESKVMTAVNFLDSKIPRDASEGASITLFTRKWEPSSLELAKFERYVQAIEDPLSVMDELEAGTITREHVEALKVVYPRLYRQVQEAVMEKVVDEGDQISYNRRIQLGILLDIPTDTSLNPSNIVALQESFIPAEPPTDRAGAVKPTSGALRELDTVDEQGGSEGFLRRRRES